MKKTVAFHIILLLGIWAIAQLAVIDHVYSDAHTNDSVCEWCLNHNKSSDDYVDVNDAIKELFLSPANQSNFSVIVEAYRNDPRLHRLPRAPPIA